MKEELKREFEARIKAKKGEASSPLPLYQMLSMRLSELSRHNIALKIDSEVLGCEIWLCGNKKMSLQIKGDDPSAIIHTIDELRRLIRLNPDPEKLRAIHNTKTVFPSSTIITGKDKDEAPDFLKDE